MRILAASLALAAACSAPPKKKSDLAEGSDAPPTCCCKTIPVTAEKEIIPVYAMEGRMECSTKNGECVPDVQCNGSQKPPDDQSHDNGVPPPPPIAPSTSSTGIP